MSDAVGLSRPVNRWAGHKVGERVEVTCKHCPQKFTTTLRQRTGTTDPVAIYAQSTCGRCTYGMKRKRAGLPPASIHRSPDGGYQGKWAGHKPGEMVETECAIGKHSFMTKVRVQPKYGALYVARSCGKCQYARQHGKLKVDTNTATAKADKPKATTAKRTYDVATTTRVPVPVKAEPAKPAAAIAAVGFFGRQVRSTDLAPDNSYPDTSVPSGRRFVMADDLVAKIAGVRRLLDSIEDDLAKKHAAHSRASARETELENRLRAIEAALAGRNGGEA